MRPCAFPWLTRTVAQRCFTTSALAQLRVASATPAASAALSLRRRISRTLRFVFGFLATPRLAHFGDDIHSTGYSTAYCYSTCYYWIIRASKKAGAQTGNR